MPHPLNSNRRSRVALGAGCAIASVFLLSSTAAAAATGTLVAGTTTLAQGASASVTATFAGDNAVQFISIDVAPLSGSAGSLSIAVVSFSGATTNCVEVTAVQVQCVWNGLANPQSGTVNLTATTSADALGTFRVTTTETSDVGGAATPSAVAGPVNLVVPAPTTTTVAPSTTVASPTTTGSTPATTATGGAGGQLPGTGSPGAAAASWIAAGLLITGATSVVLSRRRRGKAH